MEEVADGAERELHLQRTTSCSVCDGKGGTDIVTCETCKGQGVVRVARRTPLGVFATTTTCRNCNGLGERPEKICEECEGEGRVVTRNPITVKVPAGIHDGMRLHFPGEGEAAVRGGDAGDLYVVVHVEEDERFERDGSDLRISQQIGFVTACLGGEISVDVLKGKKTVNVPEGSQNGDEIRLEGEGLPELRSRNKGDLIVEIQVVVPKKVTKHQAELLKEFEKEGKKKWGLF